MALKFGASILSWIPPRWTADGGLYAIKKTAAAGFDVLEILLPLSMNFESQVVKNQLKLHGIDAVCSLNLSADYHIPVHPKKATDLIKTALIKTAELEVTLLGGVLHGGIGVFTGQSPTEPEQDIICDVWTDIAHFAEKLGIQIAVEPINRYETYVCTNANDVLQLAMRTGAANIGLHLDTFHMNIEESNFYDPVVAAGTQLKHLHITESDRGMLGEGNVRWNDLFRGLVDIKYSGALVLENFSTAIPDMAGAVSLWRPSKYDASTLANGSLDFMKIKAAEFGL